MASSNFEAIYAGVPAAQKRLLLDFRADHAYSELDVNGARWRYIACGQGDKALLFLPGGFLRADMWFHPITTFEKTYRIIAPDAFTLQRTFAVDDVCSAILEAEGVAKAITIGISAGGGVAQFLVQTHPERVEHLVFSHCGVIEGSAETQKSASRTLRLVKMLPLFVTRWVLMKRTAGNVPLSSEWIAFHNAYFREASSRIEKEMFVRFIQGSLEMRRSFVFKPETLETWPGEILVLSSKDDPLSIHSLDKLKARYPRARTHIFEEGGHHTFMFFPEAYTTALKTFLDDVRN